MTSRDLSRIIFIISVEQEGLVPKERHTLFSRLQMPDLQRNSLASSRRLDRRLVWSLQLWDVVYLRLQVTEVSEIVGEVLAVGVLGTDIVLDRKEKLESFNNISVLVTVFSLSECSISMAANPFLLPIIYSSSSSSSSSSNYSSSQMFPLLFSFFILFLSLFILIFSLYTFKNIRNSNHKNAHQIHGQAQKIPSLHVNNSEVDKNNSTHEPDPVNLTSSLLLEILPSSSAKWDNLFSGENEICEDKSGSGQEEKKRKKKRAKKKRPDPDDEAKKEVDELVCLYPFTKSSSATQRKIKLQYDQLVKSHESNAITPAQVYF
ncbi:unnamed protein product [Fraxinus pennsylvanica]|uniref:Uncharacterized protein n=1 Tax=Fraxinus pennsylvanica TaxID=56036 RepID=A0AAD1ZCF3_9LAMI|nr:unnamed protein product [Fraxinus pennsylvanica]